MSDTLKLESSRDTLQLKIATGIPGEAATVEVGTVTTLAAGSPATVVNAGNEYAAVLDFGIPAGPDGADGDVAGPGAPTVIGELVVWANTLGTNVGRAVATGLLKAASGVVSAAVAGTDYLAPAAIGVTVQAYDADTTKNDVADQVITGGAVITSLSLGTVTTGTTTLDFGARPQQHYTNGGAHTLAPDTSSGSILLDITNNGSAGAITISGWTKVVGTFTTTDTHKFRCACSVGQGGSLLQIQAMQ